MNRPGIVSLIGYLLLTGAVFQIIAGGVMYVIRNDNEVRAGLEMSGSEIVLSSVLMLIVGLIQAVVAGGILSGSKVARGLIAFVQIVGIMSSAFLMFSHHSPTFVTNALIQALFVAFVLWALFNEKADEYFNAK